MGAQYIPETAADIGAASALTDDENYVTDAEKAALHAAGSDNQDLSGLLPKTANVNTQTGTTYAIVTDDLGKDVRFTSPQRQQ